MSYDRVSAILQKAVDPAVLAAAERPLPGIQPLDPEDWLWVDETFAGQMAERARLLAGHRAAVLVMTPEGAAAAAELYDVVLAYLRGRPGYRIGAAEAERPDGATVALDPDDPLGTLGHLVAEDMCLIAPRGEVHVLAGALLCFPASWLLAEKIGRPLVGVHEPVDAYDEGVARRVQRLFDGVKEGRPLWRANALRYADAALHQPRSAHARRDRLTVPLPYLRCERQCMVRLPISGAVVFSIHTTVVEVGV